MKKASLLRGFNRAAGIALAVTVTVRASAEVAQLSLPMKTGEVFMVDHFDFKVTRNDMGFNFNSGNMGEINDPTPGSGQEPIVVADWSTNSCGTDGGSWLLSYDFSGYPSDAFCGGFLSLAGLTDTLVELAGTGTEPVSTTVFTNHFLNFDNVYGAFVPWAGRSIDAVAFDTCLQSGSAALTVKVELKDMYGWDVFARVLLTSADWGTATLPRGYFSHSTKGTTAPFRWDKVRTMAVIVERNHDADGIHNPVGGGFLVDNIRLADTDGSYPDLTAARDPAAGGLLPAYRDAFLDHIRKLSFLYFLDFASTDPRTGGMIHDRGSFADLMTVGGTGFQLTSYVIGAERGYLARTSAAERVAAVLRELEGQPQGTNRVGTAGYNGFFYHFLGIDGLRKQNFDFVKTAGVNEALNTVEVSTIDTALALMGVITAKQYFKRDDPVEAEIRALALTIIRRVKWPFMLAHLPDGKRQAYLGWKPVETRDESQGRFLLPDGQGTGFFSSKEGTNGVEDAATLDYYTDEALLIALLGMAAPDSTNSLPRAVWDDIIRKGDGFVKTYPGALFTYQFLSCWVDTQAMGRDNHALRPADFFENTRQAIAATRAYAMTNANGSAGTGADAWEYSACEGPFDGYGAEGAPVAALADYTLIADTAGSRLLEGESATGDGVINYNRGAASGMKTRWITQTGGQINWTFDVATNTLFNVVIQYSNDGPPTDVLAVSVDGNELGRFTTIRTGSGGMGWFTFAEVEMTNGLVLAAGTHTARVTVVSCDYYGVEVDVVRMEAQGIPRPLESGTLTPYSAGSSILHLPDEAVAALWHAANLDLNGDGVPDLLHPRYGFADAFNVDIAGTWASPGREDILRRAGAWANMTGFAIDQGPLLILLDNYLDGQFVPKLVMSDPDIHRALAELFDGPPDIYAWDTPAGETGTLKWKSAIPAVVEACDDLAAPDWGAISGSISNNVLDVALPTSGKRFFRIRQVE